MILQQLTANGLVIDGAMGTELIKLGLKNGESSALWSETNPGRVMGIHNEYRHAGAQAITTNTFAASPLALRRVGLEEKAADLCERSVRIARAAAGSDGFVLGDIGPCGEFMEPLGDVTAEELADNVSVQAEAMMRAGVDAFLVETMSDPNEMHHTIMALKPYGVPVFATYTFDRSGSGFRTMMGATPASAIRTAVDAGADAVGANCGNSLGLDDYLELGKQVVEAADGLPVILQPNAGSPETVGGNTYYSLMPEEMLPWTVRARALGASAIGGCCGTTPDHIRMIALAFAAEGGATR